MFKLVKTAGFDLAYVSDDSEKLMPLFLLLIIYRYTLKPNDQILAEDKHKALCVSPTLQHVL